MEKRVYCGNPCLPARWVNKATVRNLAELHEDPTDALTKTLLDRLEDPDADWEKLDAEKKPWEKVEGRESWVKVDSERDSWKLL